MALKTGEESPQGIRLVFLVVFFFANRYKELAEKLVQLEESFVHSSRLAFQNKKFMEQSNVVFFVWFFLVFFVIRQSP